MFAVFGLATLTAACSKPEPPSGATPGTASAQVAPSPGVSALPSSATDAGASALVATDAGSGAETSAHPSSETVAPPSTPSRGATPSQGAAPSVAPPGSAAPPAVVLHPAAARSASPRWTIDFATAGCAAGTDCVATLRVQAQGDYHVNPDYRFRFVPDAAQGVTYSAGTPADFARDGAKAGTMTLHYVAPASGPVTLSGTFKICVCTDTLCAPESVAVSLLVPVS